MSVIFCDRCQRIVDLDFDVDHMEDHDSDDGEEVQPERQGGDPLPNFPGFSRKILKGGK